MKQIFKIVRESVGVVPGHESFTPGKMYLDNVFFCQTCEDEDRHLEEGGEKVHGRTAIPRGTYRVVTSHSPHFDRILPEVLDVPQFVGVRIHGGNHAEDSEGCVLVGRVRTSTGIAQCAVTVQRIIDAIDHASELGIETWLEIE